MKFNIYVINLYVTSNGRSTFKKKKQFAKIYKIMNNFYNKKVLIFYIIWVN